MGHPSKLRLFKLWARAMEDGATVDKPSYRGTATSASRKKVSGPRRRSTHQKVRRRKRAQKTQD